MIDGLLQRARNRLILGELLTKLTMAGVFFFAALVLLLLLGTQILNVWAPLALGLATFGAGVVWVFWKAPSASTTARILDQRCGLADSLSTELHFRDSAQSFASVQRSKAEADAAQVHLESALPLPRPRSAYAVAGLAALALALFLFRYGFERQLQLSAPISFMRFGPLDLAARAEENAAKARAAAKAVQANPNGMSPELMSRLGTSTPDNPNAHDLQTPAESAITTGGDSGKDSEQSGLSEGKDGKGQSGAGDSSESDAAPSPKAGADQPPSGQDGSPQSAQSGGKTANPAESASSMMSKLRDAVSSMMSKMKPQDKSASQPGQQSAQPANGKPPTGQPGAPKAGDQNAKGSSSPQDGDESAATDPEAAAPGQGAGKSSDQNAAAKPGSGMGKQDGSKELRDAEQLAAMGKLSEIIGKRSANVTGEMTIEPQSGPQQLRTGYTHSNARHGESGGDVSRDEVPVALQGYVQQYFEQVRKQGAVKPAPNPGTNQ